MATKAQDNTRVFNDAAGNQYVQSKNCKDVERDSNGTPTKNANGLLTRKFVWGTVRRLSFKGHQTVNPSPRQVARGARRAELRSICRELGLLKPATDFIRVTPKPPGLPTSAE